MIKCISDYFLNNSALIYATNNIFCVLLCSLPDSPLSGACELNCNPWIKPAIKPQDLQMSVTAQVFIRSHFMSTH